MNRRNFLKTLWGGAVAVVTAPLVKLLPATMATSWLDMAGRPMPKTLVGVYFAMSDIRAGEYLVTDGIGPWVYPKKGNA